MPTYIPTTFSRHNKTYIPVGNGGKVIVTPTGGDTFWISAPGQKQQRVEYHELPSVVRELVHRNGGPVPHMPAPQRDQPWNPYERAKQIVNNLLEDDKEMARIRKRVEKAKFARELDSPEVQQADDPTAFVAREVARRGEPIKKLEVRGRRWYRRGAGGVYCKAYIYINDELVHVTAEQYGSGDHYLTLAKDWLQRNGYLAGLLDDERDPLWHLRDKHEINLQYGVIDVPRERDL